MGLSLPGQARTRRWGLALLLVLPWRLWAATLTVTPITWDVIGLDSNNVNVGPNLYLVGVRGLVEPMFAG